MTNKRKRQYRIRNWRDYNSALVSRGSLTLWVEQRVIDKWRDTAAPLRRGRRRFYSDLAITCALTLREVYGLPLRATQGLTRSVLRLLGAEMPAPHYSTLSRRAAWLDVKPPRLSKGPLHLAVDSMGVKLYGEGEWKVRLHGAERRRTWRKLHLLIDHRTHEALACSMSEQYVLDRKALPGLLGGVEGEVAEVLGDGAYDFHDCYKPSARRARAQSSRRRSGRMCEAGLSSAAVTRRCCAGARSAGMSGRRMRATTVGA